MNLVKVTRGRNASTSWLTGPTISLNRGASQALPASANTRCMSMTASQPAGAPGTLTLRPAPGRAPTPGPAPPSG